MLSELSPDQKGQASLTLAQVIDATRNNFPDERYRPRFHLNTPYYHIGGIDPSPYSISVNADGIGTKPELAERLTDSSRPIFGGEPRDYSYFESLAFDTIAMIESDAARWGMFMLGVANVLDTNRANPAMIDALARGLLKACDEGEFALLNGEAAELGYRTSGYGEDRINWNAFGLSLVVPDKLILGEELAPGQLVVGLQETSIRSNGLSKARQILETAYLSSRGYPDKLTYILEELSGHFYGDQDIEPPELDATNIQFLSGLMGHNFFEQVQVPWHDDYSKIIKELLKPSTLYSPFMYAAQNGIEGRREIDIVAAAHISGGGVPEKVRRMIEPKRLGAHLDQVFPDPEGVRLLLALAETLPEEESQKLIEDREACEQWNRGVGFVVVVKSREDAQKLWTIGQSCNIPATTIGEILADPVIQWRGHSWRY